MAVWWAQAAGSAVLSSRLNKTISPASTACFFGRSFTHAHTRVAAGAIFRRPVDRTAVATTTQRHMHSWNTLTDCLFKRLPAFGYIIQSSSSSACVHRTSIRANPVAAVSPLPTRQLQPTRSVATHPQSTDNRHRFRGVYWYTRDSIWKSVVPAIKFHVGYFDCQFSAARHTDTAIRYLVQCKVLDEKYLARTNVGRGLLEQFVPTAEETERVARRWREKVEREYASLFRGVTTCGRAIGSGRKWQARFTDESGTQSYVGCFPTDVEAACAVDVAVRASKLPKVDKIRRINFYKESDYLTESQARRGGCIGAYRLWVGVSRPWSVQKARISSIAKTANAPAQKNGFVIPTHLGNYATKLEAIEAYDRFVLNQWAQLDEPRGPLPPTNLCPTRYGCKLISPPTIAPVKKIELVVVENAPKKKGRPCKNTPPPQYPPFLPQESKCSPQI